MEHTPSPAPWRIWVNTQERIVSFHEEEGFDLLEFHSPELFQRCVDGYVCRSYRYQ